MFSCCEKARMIIQMTLKKQTCLMLCIFLVVAYPYDRLLEPPGLLKETTIVFTDRRQISTQTKVRLWTNKSFSSPSETYFQFHLPTLYREGGGGGFAICLLDTNQKVKIYLMDDRDSVNLLGHILWAHTEQINILCPLRHKGRPAEHHTTTEVPWDDGALHFL